jgi:hypothetical protein
MSPNNDFLTYFSDWVDRHVFTIRTIITTTASITCVVMISKTKHGKRVRPHSSFLQNLTAQKCSIFGKFLVHDHTLYFYHEPLFLRLLMGRTAFPRLSDCLRVDIKGINDSKYFKTFLDNRMGLLQLEGGGTDTVIGVPKIKLKWYHLWRTNMHLHAGKYLAKVHAPSSTLGIYLKKARISWFKKNQH